jgi:hypothetical protein
VAVAAGIRSDDVCIPTVLGLGRGWEFDDAMLPVLEWAVRDSDESLRYLVEIALRRAAWDLTASNLERLERLCSDDPGALVAHLILISYYSFVEHRLRTPESATNRRRHALWMVRNAPWCGVLTNAEGMITSEDPAAFSAAKSLWREHIAGQSNDARILVNAAVFFSSDEPDHSLSLLHRARTLGPLDPGVASLLFRLEHEWNRSAMRSPPDPQNLRWTHNN